jgi:hypothetical protein
MIANLFHLTSSPFEGGDKMRRTVIDIYRTTILLALMLLLVVPAGAMAVDTDMDGFTDIEEAAGITLADDNGNPTITVPPCAFTPGEDRNSCLDPATPDLFVIIAPAATDSLIPVDSLAFINKSKANGGLEVATHRLNSDQAPSTRLVTDTQKAVRITENTDASPGEVILGIANQGTPNGLDRATVYTHRIANHVTDVYASAGQTPPDGFIDEYIRHTIAHEIGHMTDLSVDYNRRFGGYHFKTGSEVLMEQSVVYSVKKNVVTFKLSRDFSEPSQTGVTLK